MENNTLESILIELQRCDMNVGEISKIILDSIPNLNWITGKEQKISKFELTVSGKGYRHENERIWKMFQGYFESLKAELSVLHHKQQTAKLDSLSNLLTFCKARFEEKYELSIQDSKFDEISGDIEGFKVGRLRIFEDAFSYIQIISKGGKAVYPTTSKDHQEKNHTEELPKTIHKPIIWNDKAINLGTLFFELQKQGRITSSKKDIERMILDSFVDKENLRFSPATISDALNDGKAKAKSNPVNLDFLPDLE